MAGTLIAAVRSGVRWLWLAVAALCLVSTGTCAGEGYAPHYGDKPATAGATEYVFAVYPLHNPERLFATYAPIMDFLTEQVPGARFRFEASRNYEDFGRKLIERKFHFVLCNPLQILTASQHGYRVFAKLADDAQHYGIILVRNDSTIDKVADLKGEKISYPSPSALAATVMPQYFLHRQGLDVNRDVENVYVGSQESAMLNVYHGLTIAAGTWTMPWIKFQEAFPEKARELVVKWKTEPLANNCIVVREDVPPQITARVAELLLGLHETDSGRKLLHALPVSRFEPANGETYAATKAFLLRFHTEIRPVIE